jgi:transcriptional regulator GlxA family with amidase domain
MKHISILIPEGATSLSNLEATYKMFSMVNEALERAGGQPLFQLQMVALSHQVKLKNGPFSIQPEAAINEVTKTDLIIIPAVHGDIKEVLAVNKDLLPWIVQQYESGAEIVSLCIGAFLLAATGLLRGKSCTTHWLMAENFRAMFPDVDLQPYKILTDEGGIYTSGGAYSSLNLILYLIEKYAGRAMALQSSKIFEIDIDRSSQSPFIMFQAQKEHGDEPIKKAQEFIERHFGDKITVDALAAMLALGRRNLERRFKKATSNTVVEYIQRVKIEAAKKSFESSRKNISEVMYDVGYLDSKAFRTVFKSITGLSPAAYKSRYNKEIAVMADA